MEALLLPHPPKPGAMLYAKDIASLARFYGALNEPDQEWEWEASRVRGDRVRDGYDPEGNVLQLRVGLA